MATSSLFDTLTGSGDKAGLLDKLGNLGDKVNAITGKATGWSSLVGSSGPAAPAPGTTSPPAAGAPAGSSLAAGGVGLVVSLAVGVVALLVVGYLALKGR